MVIGGSPGVNGIVLVLALGLATLALRLATLALGQTFLPPAGVNITLDHYYH